MDSHPLPYCPQSILFIAVGLSRSHKKPNGASLPSRLDLVSYDGNVSKSPLLILLTLCMITKWRTQEVQLGILVTGVLLYSYRMEGFRRIAYSCSPIREFEAAVRHHYTVFENLSA